MSSQIDHEVSYNGSKSSSLICCILIIKAGPTGGDALTIDLNQWYSPGDVGFIIVSAALVLLMMPGLGYFYAGLARRKSALSLILVCVMAYCVTSFQWYFWGYSV
jgi:ammonium transporter, Amt family